VTGVHPSRPRDWIRIVSGFNWICGSGSKAKITRKKKDLKKFYVFKAGCSLWGPGGFSCSMKTLYRNLKTKMMHFLLNSKIFRFFVQL
jgi:hypothetical protein